MFNARQLRLLIIPLVIEQLLAATVGIVDTLMVAQVGEHAMSGVGLINSINVLLFTVFSALSTGGSIITAQYLGRRDERNARRSANQMLQSSTAIALFLTLLCVCLHKGIFQLVYGNVEASVRESALSYFLITAMAFPAMAVYNTCASAFRCMGNSRLPMFVSVSMNILNAIGNAIFIFLCGMGAAGAALATLLSRIYAACVMFFMLRKRDLPVNISELFPLRWDWKMIRRILYIGIPTGIENSIFQLGKIMVQSFVSTLGTAAIAANTLMDNITSITYLPAMSLGMALVTVAGQCAGAGKFHQLRRYTTGFVLMSGVSYLVLLGLLCVFIDPVIALYSVSAEAAEIGKQLLYIIFIPYVLLWPISFTLPNALRAAGDVRFSMIVAVATMWIFRVGLGWFLCIHMGYGVAGVWISMAVDWLFRAIFYGARYMGRRWEQHHILDSVEEKA